MGKTGDLFKKIKDMKGTFHAKICTVKDRNGMDLTEAEHFKTWMKLESITLGEMRQTQKDNCCTCLGT